MEKYNKALEFLEMNYNPNKFMHLEKYLAKESNSKQVECKPKQKKIYKAIQKTNAELEDQKMKLKQMKRENFMNEQLDLGDYGRVKSMFKVQTEKLNDYKINTMDDPDTKKVLL